MATNFNIVNRTISLPPNLTDIVVQGDTNSKTITFEMARYFDGVDLTTKTIKIAYMNAKSETGYSDAYVKQVDINTFTFNWSVPGELTKEFGEVSISVEFSETNTSNKKTYVWKTKPKNFKVEKSFTVLENATPQNYLLQQTFYLNNTNDDTSKVNDSNEPIYISNRRILMPVIEDIVVSGDTRSQIVSFTMPRFFENVDLSSKVISIKFINAKNQGDRSSVVNVVTTDDTISFGWLIDGKVTVKEGYVNFAVEFLGYDENNKFYCWSTTPAQLQVSKGLIVDELIEEPEPSWIQSWELSADDRINRKFNELSTAKQIDSEVILARGKEKSLKERLDKNDSLMAQKANEYVVKNIQSQVNEIVLQGTSGDSSAEVAQDRVDLDGFSYPTIKSKSDAVEKAIRTGIKELKFRWTQGTVSSSFANTSSSTRVRTDAIVFSNLAPINVRVPTGYKLYRFKKDLNGNITYPDYGSDFTLVPEEGCEYKLVLAKTDNTEVNTNIADLFTFYTNYNNIVIDNIYSYVNDNTSNIRNTDINAVKKGYIKDINNQGLWEQGTISTDGTTTSSTTRVRVKDFIDKDVRKIVCNDDYEFLVFIYKEDYTLLYYIDGYKKEYEHYKSSVSNLPYKILLRKTSLGAITTEDSKNINFLIGDISYLEELKEKTQNNEWLNPNDFFAQAKGNLGFSILELQLENLVNQYIEQNGLLINGESKTRNEIKHWILNRNNCMYRGKLHKNGQQLLDSNNQPIELLGIGTHELLNYSSLHTKESLETLKYYGVNCIRITAYVGNHTFPYTTGVNGTTSQLSYGYIAKPEETKAVIEGIVENCKELGLYAIIDWHVLAGDGDANQYSAEMQSFFQYFSSKYASYDNVLYELLNEPHANTAAEIGSLMKASYDIIHYNVTDPVIITGKASDYIDYLHTVCINNNMDVFMSQHFYKTGSSVGETVANEIQTHYDKGYALFCTEWGNADGLGAGTPNDDWAEPVINKLHDLGISQCVWKFTYQNMATAVLKWSPMATNDGYKYGGFIEKDLSHNGVFYFNHFKKYWLES